MLEIKEWMGKEIGEVDPFLRTSDQAAGEQVATVNTEIQSYQGFVTWLYILTYSLGVWRKMGFLENWKD